MSKLKLVALTAGLFVQVSMVQGRRGTHLNLQDNESYYPSSWTPSVTVEPSPSEPSSGDCGWLDRLAGTCGNSESSEPAADYYTPPPTYYEKPVDNSFKQYYR